MDILKDFSLNCNKKYKFNFDGGNLSSDAGLLLIKDFADKLGFEKLIKNIFKTNDLSKGRLHLDSDNLLQMIYQVMAGYHQDDFADELSYDPVMTSILDKDRLASQPTLSRFFNRMDETTMEQFNQIIRSMRKTVYSIQKPEYILLDLDSTLLETYGKQEGQAFNYHYQQNGYHPLVCYDALTGDLLKAQLREGAKYCSNGSGEFMDILLNELKQDIPKTNLFMRADSGFATPTLYDVLEKHNCKYIIRLKANPNLYSLIQDEIKDLLETAMDSDTMLDYHVRYGEFTYQATSWDNPRKVIYKIEKSQGQLMPQEAFFVTTMEDLTPEQLVKLYNDRGSMENFIKESKRGFSFSSTSSKSMMINSNRLQLRVIAYNLFNYFRRLVLPKNISKHYIETIRNKLLKVATKVVKKSRYIVFKLCSSFAYKQTFSKILKNICNLQVYLE